MSQTGQDPTHQTDSPAVEAEVDGGKSETSLPTLEQRFDVPMLIAAIAVIPALLIEQTATDANVVRVAWVVNVVIWGMFLTEYAILLHAAEDRWAYVRSHKFDLAIVILSPPLPIEALSPLSALRSLRILRLLRATRFARLFAAAARALSAANGSLRRHGTYYVLVAALIIILVAGGAVHLLERNRVATVWDGLWWALATVTTVDNGSVSPETPFGKVLSLILRVVGMGLMAVITASIASWFIQRDREAQEPDVAAQLVEARNQLARLENLLAERENPADSSGEH